MLLSCRSAHSKGGRFTGAASLPSSDPAGRIQGRDEVERHDATFVESCRARQFHVVRLATKRTGIWRDRRIGWMSLRRQRQLSQDRFITPSCPPFRWTFHKEWSRRDEQHALRFKHITNKHHASRETSSLFAVRTITLDYADNLAHFGNYRRAVDRCRDGHRNIRFDAENHLSRRRHIDHHDGARTSPATARRSARRRSISATSTWRSEIGRAHV